MTPGALCTDATFTRVLGSPGDSEPILADLIGAWHQARTGDAAAAAVAVEVSTRKVLSGLGLHDKGSLTVDVRAVTDRESYLVEVQHRPEAYFPHRALVYSAAEVVTHHISHPIDLSARRVHTLAFCDYDFQDSLQGTLGIKSSRWRTAAPHTRVQARALQVFGLHASPRAMVGFDVNPALERMLAQQASFVFALLPHAPRLNELTPATPPLLRWAALVAHVAPDNIDDVPKDLRIGGVARLLEMLDATASTARAEREEADRRAADDAQALEDARAEAEAKGKAEGKAEGMATALRLVGVENVASYRAHFGADPPAQLAPFLSR